MFRTCQQLASTVQYLEHSLLLFVTSASDLQIQYKYNGRFVRRHSTKRRGVPYKNNNKSVRTIKQNSFKSFLEYVSVNAYNQIMFCCLRSNVETFRHKQDSLRGASSSVSCDQQTPPLDATSDVTSLSRFDGTLFLTPDGRIAENRR